MLGHPCDIGCVIDRARETMFDPLVFATAYIAI